MRGPRRLTDGELRKFGITMTDKRSLRFVCNTCGMKWSPVLLKGGRLPRGWWECPEGCNCKE